MDSNTIIGVDLSSENNEITKPKSKKQIKVDFYVTKIKEIMKDIIDEKIEFFKDENNVKYAPDNDNFYQWCKINILGKADVRIHVYCRSNIQDKEHINSAVKVVCNDLGEILKELGIKELMKLTIFREDVEIMERYLKENKDMVDKIQDSKWYLLEIKNPSVKIGDETPGLISFIVACVIFWNILLLIFK